MLKSVKGISGARNTIGKCIPNTSSTEIAEILACSFVKGFFFYSQRILLTFCTRYEIILPYAVQNCRSIYAKQDIFRFYNEEISVGLSFWGHGLTLILEWISNLTPNQAWNGITYPFLICWKDRLFNITLYNGYSCWFMLIHVSETWPGCVNSSSCDNS